MSERFAGLGFEGFKALARDPSLSPHEKVGFPNSYRDGKERLILEDIAGKLSHLRGERKAVLDIGPGCSPLATALLALCREREHRLTLVDSAEMLALLPDPPGVTKAAGRFPDDCLELLEERRGGFDAVLAYSVLQYVFAEGDVLTFLDQALSLLAEGGQLLLGDIPNRSMRRRFFASAAGARHHREFTGRDEAPPADPPAPEEIDDAAVVALLLRARAAGFHAHLVPQAPALPMANRREDLLVVRP